MVPAGAAAWGWSRAGRGALPTDVLLSDLQVAIRLQCGDHRLQDPGGIVGARDPCHNNQASGPGVVRLYCTPYSGGVATI